MTITQSLPSEGKMGIDKELYDRSKTQNIALLKWLDKMVEMCQPSSVQWCDGSDDEWDQLCEQMIEQIGRAHV